jgi:nitrogen fixation protein NifZ
MTTASHEALGLMTELTLGAEVVTVEDLLQDGSYPDADVARDDVLVPAGTPGRIVDIGSYLQRHTIYAVAFGNGRLVGCLAREITLHTQVEVAP